MNLSVSPYALILLLSGASTIIMTLVVYKRLKNTERSFALMLGLAGWWALGYAAELSSSTYRAMLFWLHIEYVAICLLPPTLLFFTRVFVSGQKRYSTSFYAFIFTVPIITFLAVWTNNYHHFYYKNLNVDNTGPFPVLKIDPAFGYFIFTGFWYLMLAWSVYLLSTGFNRADDIYKKQKNVILFAIIVPWISNLIYKLGLGPDQNIDLTPFAFIITALIISFGFLRYQLLDVIPAAREKIFETMKEGVIVLDTKYRVIDRNARMKEILKLRQKDFKGEHIADLFPRNEELLEEVSARKDTSLEIEINTDNETFYEVSVNVLLDKNADFNGSILIFHDITQLKKDAISLTSLNSLKDRIFSIIAHDLRTPMMNITDLVKLVDEKLITEDDFRRFLPELSNNLNYTSGLLDNLLHWSKSQLKGEAVKFEIFEINDIVEHEIIYFEQKAADKGITFKNLVKQNTLVKADAEMLKLVIRNLLGNAIKFCNKNDSIIISAVSNNRNEFEICVEDTGCGMKPEIVEKLFMSESFTLRGTNNEKGTGLGLQLCKDFIEKNNGRIWVNTTWGEGSKFYFTVPAATDVLSKVG